MVVLRFNDESVWRDCCDPAHMRRRWGAARTRQISHRLQQIDAMTSLADLDFLPLDCRTVDGRVEVDVDEDLVLVLEQETPQQGDLMTTVFIRALATRSRKTAR
jgi:hypothetical protein